MEQELIHRALKRSVGEWDDECVNKTDFQVCPDSYDSLIKKQRNRLEQIHRVLCFLDDAFACKDASKKSGFELLEETIDFIGDLICVAKDMSNDALNNSIELYDRLRQDQET